MTQISSTTFKSNTTTLYADNTTGNIGADDLRTQMDNTADSVVFKATGFTAPPIASDDAADTAGNGVFLVGDVWIDETNNKSYMSVDSTTGAAVWIEITDVATVTKVSTVAATELAFWTADGVIDGAPEITWSGTVVDITGDITLTGTVDGRDILTDGTKLDLIEALADVTDTANVTAAGALMDSELADIAAVKATTGTFLVADQTKLDGVEALADVTDVTNVTAAGALMDSELTAIASVKALDQGVATTDSPTFVNITPTGTVDGRDILADGTALDLIIPRFESGFPVQTFADLIAAGTTEADAAPIATGVVNVSAASAGVTDGIQLPSGTSVGTLVIVKNSTGVSVNVYAETGGQIDAGGVNVAYVVATTATVQLFKATANTWTTY
jgi:hypothetical protein